MLGSFSAERQQKRKATGFKGNPGAGRFHGGFVVAFPSDNKSFTRHRKSVPIDDRLSCSRPANSRGNSPATHDALVNSASVCSPRKFRQVKMWNPCLWAAHRNYSRVIGREQCARSSVAEPNSECKFGPEPLVSTMQARLAT